MKQRELRAEPNPAHGTRFYANRVDGTTVATTDHYLVLEIQVNTGFSYSYRPEGKSMDEEADLLQFSQAVPTVEDSKVFLRTGSQEWYYSIDFSNIIPDGWEVTVQRLTKEKPFSLGVVIFHPDYKDEVAGVHPITNADLRDPDAEQCEILFKDSFMKREDARCERVSGHLGKHQAFGALACYSWEAGGASQASPFGVFGFKATCPKCGFVDGGDASGEKTCFLCSFWEQQKQHGGKKFVIDGVHYRPGAGGFGGRKFKIQKHDGEIWSGELFTQGDIPSWLIHEFPDNAVFLKH